MNTLIPRVLHLITRTMLRIRPLRPHAWKHIQALREYYARRSPSIELLTRFDAGIRARVSLSNHIEAQLFWQGFQEADESAVELFKRLLPSDGVFVDIGANIGSFTLVGAKYSPSGYTHAFEPSDFHRQRLSHNIELNGFHNITVNSVGLSDQSGEATLHIPISQGGMTNTGAASLYIEEVSSDLLKPEKVQLIRLDDYIEQQSIQRLDLIKIDVEGAELPALRGGHKTIARFQPLVIMEMDLNNLDRSGHSVSDVLDFWRELRYNLSIIESPMHLAPITHIEDIGPHQNLLCYPADTFPDRLAVEKDS